MAGKSEGGLANSKQAQGDLRLGLIVATIGVLLLIVGLVKSQPKPRTSVEGMSEAVSSPGAPPDQQTLEQQGYGQRAGEDALPADTAPENQETDVASNGCPDIIGEWLIGGSRVEFTTNSALYKDGMGNVVDNLPYTIVDSRAANRPVKAAKVWTDKTDFRIYTPFNNGQSITEKWCQTYLLDRKKMIASHGSLQGQRVEPVSQ